MDTTPYNSTKNPFIAKCFEVSSCHISKHDCEHLKRDSKDTSHNPTLIIYPFDYGYFVFAAWEKEVDEEIQVSLYKEGYSKEFAKLLQVARQHGCKYLQIDEDGVEYEDLHVFNW